MPEQRPASVEAARGASTSGHMTEAEPNYVPRRAWICSGLEGNPSHSWVRERVALAAEVAFDFGRVPEKLEPFMESYDRSKALQRLLCGRAEDLKCFEVVIGCLLQALIPQLEWSENPVPEHSEEGKRLKRNIPTLRKAVAILREEGERELARAVMLIAGRLDLRLVPARLGAPLSPQGTVCLMLEGHLTTFTELSPPDRRQLIAQLVTDFVKPMTAEQVRFLVKDWSRRRARNPRSEGVPHYLDLPHGLRFHYDLRPRR